MQVVFFIEDPPVIKRILKHLDLREEQGLRHCLWNSPASPVQTTFHGKMMFTKSRSGNPGLSADSSLRMTQSETIEKINRFVHVDPSLKQ